MNRWGAIWRPFLFGQPFLFCLKRKFRIVSYLRFFSVRVNLYIDWIKLNLLMIVI